jgi:hypothetical protein
MQSGHYGICFGSRITEFPDEPFQVGLHPRNPNHSAVIAIKNGAASSAPETKSIDFTIISG